LVKIHPSLKLAHQFYRQAGLAFNTGSAGSGEKEECDGRDTPHDDEEERR
jgi:hypothetical protein